MVQQIPIGQTSRRLWTIPQALVGVIAPVRHATAAAEYALGMLGHLRAWNHERIMSRLGRGQKQQRPFEKIPWEEFRRLLRDAHEGG